MQILTSAYGNTMVKSGIEYSCFLMCDILNITYTYSAVYSI